MIGIFSFFAGAGFLDLGFENTHHFRTLFVNEFKNRYLGDIYPFVIVDAKYLRVRENHRIVTKAFMVAMGITKDGRREIIGV